MLVTGLLVTVWNDKGCNKTLNKDKIYLNIDFLRQEFAYQFIFLAKNVKLDKIFFPLNTSIIPPETSFLNITSTPAPA